MCLAVLCECDAARKAACVDHESCGALEIVEGVLASVEEATLWALELAGQTASDGLDGGMRQRQAKRHTQDSVCGFCAPCVGGVGLEGERYGVDLVRAQGVLKGRITCLKDERSVFGQGDRPVAALCIACALARSEDLRAFWRIRRKHRDPVALEGQVALESLPVGDGDLGRAFGGESVCAGVS